MTFSDSLRGSNAAKVRYFAYLDKDSLLFDFTHSDRVFRQKQSQATS